MAYDTDATEFRHLRDDIIHSCEEYVRFAMDVHIEALVALTVDGAATTTVHIDEHVAKALVSADWHTKAVRGTDTRGRRRSRWPSRSRRGRGRATGTVRAVSPSSTRASPREQLVARRQLATSAPQSTSVESRDQNSLHYAYTQEASTAVVQITGRHASLIPVSSL